jgi:preprotein translocase subunit Sec63
LTSDREPDPYAVLNVPRSATPSEIRAAYQNLVKRYHPDLHQGNPLEELASARLAEINRAYEILSDATRRAAYEAGSAVPRSGTPVASAMGKRLILGAIFLLVVPLVFRLGAVVIRGLVGLTRALFEATASFPGGRLAAVTILALTILVVVLLRRRRS